MKSEIESLTPETHEGPHLRPQSVLIRAAGDALGSPPSPDRISRVKDMLHFAFIEVPTGAAKEAPQIGPAYLDASKALGKAIKKKLNKDNPRN
jgi:hypothetical protein